MPAAMVRDARTDNNHQLDPFTAAIAAAVDAAIAARLPAIIDALKRAIPKEAGPPPLDRFVRMREVAKVLGCNRSTVNRRADDGIYPPIRKQGGSAGYLASELAEIMKPEVAEVAPGKRASRPAGARP
jgi:predicted DNA-binding transcriptional regulator AlpA